MKIKQPNHTKQSQQKQFTTKHTNDPKKHNQTTKKKNEKNAKQKLG